MTPEERLDRQRKTFVRPHLERSAGQKSWPNANVLNAMALSEFVPEICRLPYDYLFRDDAVAMSEATLLASEFLGIDSITAQHDLYNLDAEAMGGKLRYYIDHCPDIDRDNQFVKGPEDLEKVRFSGLDTGRWPYVIDCYKLMEQYCGLNLYPTACGPWSLACNLYGGENLLIAAVEDPDFVHNLLDRCIKDTLIPTIRALKAILPSGSNIGFADAWCTPPMVTPSIYKEFITPHYEEWAALMAPDYTIAGCGVRLSGLKPDDKAFFWEECVKWRRTVLANEPDLTNFGAEWFRKEATDRNKPLSMLASPTFITLTTPDKAAEMGKRLCLVGKDGPTVCSVGLGNTGAKPPLDNLFSFIEACKVYGAPGADANTPFEVPKKFPVFEEFLKHKMENNPEGYTFDWLSKSGYSYLKK